MAEIVQGRGRATLWDSNTACTALGLARIAWEQLEKVDGFPKPVRYVQEVAFYDADELTGFVAAHRKAIRGWNGPR